MAGTDYANMSEGGGDSCISSQGSWSEDFSSNAENDFETSDSDPESSDTNTEFTDDDSDASDEGEKDPDNSEADDVLIHLEDYQLNPGLLFHLLMKPLDQWEYFVTKFL